jgi:predicted ArsR family transcriptional regulator
MAMLMDAPVTVPEMQRVLDISSPTAHYHLNVLLEEGLIEMNGHRPTERTGRHPRQYRLRSRA